MVLWPDKPNTPDGIPASQGEYNEDFVPHDCHGVDRSWR